VKAPPLFFYPPTFKGDPFSGGSSVSRTEMRGPAFLFFEFFRHPFATAPTTVGMGAVERRDRGMVAGAASSRKRMPPPPADRETPSKTRTRSGLVGSEPGCQIQIRPQGVKTGRYLSERGNPEGRAQGEQTSAIVIHCACCVRHNKPPAAPARPSRQQCGCVPSMKLRLTKLDYGD
jgi:hypothetical protein